MLETTKEWIRQEFNFTLRYAVKYTGDRNSTIRSCIDRSFGVVQFVANKILGYNSEDGIKLCEWWENKMLPYMNQKIMEE